MNLDRLHPWAKLDRDEAGAVRGWLSVPEHGADVAAVCMALLERSIIRRRLARLGGVGDLDDVACARLCVLAALHDIGKFNHGFQNRLDPAARPHAGHVGEVVALFGQDGAETQMLANALCFSQMQGWVGNEDGACRLLLASLCHHGRPVSPEDTTGLVNSLWWPAGGTRPLDGIAALRTQTETWYPEAWASVGTPLPSSPPFQHGLSGLMMLADWIGSDTRFFPLEDAQLPHGPDPGLRFLQSRERARSAARAIGLDPGAARSSLGPNEPGFESVSPFAPRAAQTSVMALPIPSDASVVVLEASTGDGKTEAALGHFVRLFYTGRVDGMYFALPTRTAATQIHRRVRDAVARAFPHAETRPPVVLAVPGYITVDDQEACRLPGFEVLWPDADADRWRFRGWAAEHPKRYLAGAIVVGTIDQVLLSALAVNHSHLRATALLRHLLVVDEVHASDAYMTRILEEVLRRHLRAGGHALLMSATLAANVRERLMQPGCPVDVLELAAARAESFPRVGMRVAGASEQRWAPDPGPDRVVEVRLAPIMENAIAVATVALGAAVEGAKVLIVRNTVRGCLEVQAALEEAAVGQSRCSDTLFSCRGRKAPHHSRFTPEDRRLLDGALEAAYGKQRPRGGCVAAATQTVQQSLDIDADLLISDLCPMDVLLQRLGRLHRHERPERPPGFDKARALVLVPEERDLSGCINQKGAAHGPHGLGRVYEDLRVIEATWGRLEARGVLMLPADCRQLVEDTLHPDILAAISAEKGEAWQRHGQATWGGESNRRQTARLQLSSHDAPFGDPTCLFPAGALERRIQTRLGEGDRRVVLREPAASPFGTIVRELTIPAWMVGGEVTTDPVEVHPDRAGAFAFVIGTKALRYDRWGLRPDDDAGGAMGHEPKGVPAMEEQSDAE